MNRIIAPSAQVVITGNQLINPVGATPTYEVLAGSDPSTTVMLTTNSSNFGWQIAPTNASNDTIVQVLGQTFSLPASRGEFGIYLGADANSAFKVIQRGGSELFRVNRAGNVGIGTSNPQAKLDIAAANGLRITGSQPFITLKDTNDVNGARSIISAANGDIKFVPESFTATVNPALIVKNNTGNVGLGTLGPNNRLEVNLGTGAPVDSGISIVGNTSTFGDIGLRLKNTGTGGSEWYIDSTAQGSGYGYGRLAFVNTPGSFPTMILTQDSHVGIGTISPFGGKLVVQDTTGGTAVYGTTSANGVGVYGDAPNGGYAMYANGNASQPLNTNGFVKAMLLVNFDGTINLCYNSQLTGSAAN